MYKTRSKRHISRFVVSVFMVFLVSATINSFGSSSKAQEYLPEQKTSQTWVYGSYNNSFTGYVTGIRGAYYGNYNDKVAYLYAYAGDVITYKITYKWAEIRKSQRTGIQLIPSLGSLGFDPWGAITKKDVTVRYGSSGTITARVDTKGISGLTEKNNSKYGEFYMTMFQERYSASAGKEVRIDANDYEAKVCIRIFDKPSVQNTSLKSQINVSAGEEIYEKFDCGYKRADPFGDLKFQWSNLPEGLAADKNAVFGKVNKAGEYKISLRVYSVHQNYTLYDKTFYVSLKVRAGAATHFKTIPSKKSYVNRGESVNFSTVFYDKHGNETKEPENSSTIAESNSSKDFTFGNTVTFNECSKAKNDRRITVYNTKIPSEYNEYIDYTVLGSPKVSNDYNLSVDISDRKNGNLLPVFLSNDIEMYPNDIKFDTANSFTGFTGSLVGSAGFVYLTADEAKSYFDDGVAGVYVKFKNNIEIHERDLKEYNLSCVLKNSVGVSSRFGINISFYDSNKTNLLFFEFEKHSANRANNEDSVLIKSVARTRGGDYENPDVSFTSSVGDDKFETIKGSAGDRSTVKLTMKTLGERTIKGVWHYNNKHVESDEYTITYYGEPRVNDVSIDAYRNEDLDYSIEADAFPLNTITYSCNNLPEGISITSQNKLTGKFKKAGDFDSVCQVLNSAGKGKDFHIRFHVKELTPELLSISPSKGKTAGNETISVKGTNINGDMSVYFGDKKANVLSIKDNEITVQTPAHSYGNVDIIVKNNFTSAKLSNGFYYYEPETEKPVAIKDVPLGNVHRENIIWAYKNGLTIGCSPEMYCPVNSVNRGSMATFLRRLAGNPEDTRTDNPFVDLNEKNIHYKNILWLYHAGITTGTTSQTYSPNLPVSRGAMASFLYRLAGSPEYNPTQEDLNRYSDIYDSQHGKAIMWLAKQGITVTKEKYNPTGRVTRAQMASFLRRYHEKFIMI